MGATVGDPETTEPTRDPPAELPAEPAQPAPLPAPIPGTPADARDVRRIASIAHEKFISLVALLVSKGVISPDEADFVLHSTGHHATLNQPEPAPYSGVPMGGVQ